MRNSRNVFYFIVVASFVVAILPLVFYLSVFRNGLSDSDQNWANFGSFLGGTVTSVFSFISFVLVLYTFLRSTEDRKKDEVNSLFFRHIEMLENCRNNVSVNMGNQKQQGQEVFSTFSGIVASMSIEPEMGEIAAKTVRTPQEQTKLQGICSTYFFYRNSVKQFTDLLAITLDFVLLESGEHKERFLRLLISQLSEQEIMAYGILNHRVVGKELEERLFVSTLQFGGIKNMAEKSEFVSSKMVP